MPDYCDELLPTYIDVLADYLKMALELIETPDFYEAVEKWGDIMIVCMFAQLADKLDTCGIDEEKRVAIARLGQDRELGRANELFEALASPEKIAKASA